MNDLSKIYTKNNLKQFSLVSFSSESIDKKLLLTAIQTVDLMKKGENVLVFSFSVDSIRMIELIKGVLNNESEPEKITGGLSVIDIHQLDGNKDSLKEITRLYREVRNSTLVNFVIFDVIDCLSTNEISKRKIAEFIRDMAIRNRFTAIIQGHNNDLIGPSIGVMQISDLVFSLKSNKKSFWKKVINFLLFWKKRGNFVIKSEKNRFGPDGVKYEVNFDLENFNCEIL